MHRIRYVRHKNMSECCGRRNEIVKNHYDAVIIGGGVIGCSTAYQLAKKGAHVLLLERDRIASGASSAAAGMLGAQSEMISSVPLFKLACRSRALFPALAEELKERSGIDIGLNRKGLLRIATSE